MWEKSNSLSLNTLEKHKQNNIIRMLVCYILETYIQKQKPSKVIEYAFSL